MRAHWILFICIALCVHDRFVSSQPFEFGRFGDCGSTALAVECPDHATCVNDKCVCNSGFAPVDEELTVDDEIVTVCREAICDPRDGEGATSDCSGRGECVIGEEGYRYGYGFFYCLCDPGYYGERCESTTPLIGTRNPIFPFFRSTTTMTTTTRRYRGGLPILLGGGAIGLVALAALGAALASTSG
ncbi:tenascin-like [Saccostrea cucullata]|uniref:tenascin-like n=1 Tax=Saccostrea cuccullata TaxID=36930 RepID=UPI002ED129CD